MLSIRHVTAFNIVDCTFLRVHLCGTPKYFNFSNCSDFIVSDYF